MENYFTLWNLIEFFFARNSCFFFFMNFDCILSIDWLSIGIIWNKQWTWLNAESLGSFEFDGICISVLLFSLGNWKLISLCFSVSSYWGMWICSNFVSVSCGFNFSLEIFAATSVVCPRADVAYCVQALAKRLGKTRSWMVCHSKYFGLLDDLFFHECGQSLMLEFGFCLCQGIIYYLCFFFLSFFVHLKSKWKNFQKMVEELYAMRLLSQVTEWSVVSLSHNERLNIDLQVAICQWHFWVS